MKLLLILGAMTISVMCQSNRCPSSITHDNQHTFILAALTEKEIDDRRPEALYKEAAEACYKDCNSAEIMSFSTSYWKHRSPMTILDRAAKFLIEADFLQINDTYFVNHISAENEWPVGLGCFALETPSEFSLYPLDDPVCSSTSSVVCGMPSRDSTVDGQKIANAIHTLEPPTDKNNTIDTVNPDDGNSTHHTIINLPSSGINLAEVITRVTSSDDNADAAAEAANRINSNVGGEETEGKNEVSFFNQDEYNEEENVSIGDFRYNVIRLHQSQASSSTASLLCDSHSDKLGSLYSSSIPHFSTWFQRAYPSRKIIIESWNGDSYGARDAQCLMFSTSQGVHLGECVDASTLLCEG